MLVNVLRHAIFISEVQTTRTAFEMIQFLLFEFHILVEIQF